MADTDRLEPRDVDGPSPTSFRAVCCSTVGVFVSFGDVLDDDDAGGDDNAVTAGAYDGLVSTMIFCLFYVAVPITTTLCRALIPDDIEHDLPVQSIEQCTILVYVLLGILAISAFAFWKPLSKETQGYASAEEKHHERHHHQQRQHHENREHHGMSNKLELIGIGLFGTAGLFLFLFIVVAEAECRDVWMVCADSRRSFFISSFTNAACIVFIILEIFFCVFFHKRHFRRRATVRYGLVVVLGANVALWFDSLVNDSIEWRSPIGYRLNHSTFCYQDIDWQRFDNCTEGTTPIYGLLKGYIYPFLYPLVIEFTLLVGEGLVHWYVHRSTVDVFGRVDTAEGSSDVDDIRPTSERSILSIACVLFAALTSIVFVCFGLLTYLPKPYWRAYTAGQIVCLFVMLVACAFGYVAASRGRRRRPPVPFTGLEYVVILSSLGIFISCILCIISTLFYIIKPGVVARRQQTVETFHIETDIVKLHLAMLIVDFVQFVVQAPLMLLAKRVRFVENDANGRRWQAVMKCVLICLALYNFVFWLADSFIEMKNAGVQSIESTLFYDSSGSMWATIENITLPFVFFYRFNSVILLLRAYFSL